MKKRPLAHLRGAHAEKIVCHHFLLKGYRVRHHQRKIFGVEFDWIFEGPNGFAYVEVKSVTSAPFFIQRWPWKQRQRFVRVAAVVAANEKAQFYLALVDYDDKVHLFKVGEEL